jgi:hypothetical protein
VSDKRRSTEGALPDGVAERGRGYGHNPNAEGEIAAQKARFNERQRTLQRDLADLAKQVRAVQQAAEAQAQAAQELPARQAFVPEQRAHQRRDREIHTGTTTGTPHIGAARPADWESGRQVPLDTIDD